VLLESSLIDVHSHVLWGLDDGARTMEDSLAMLRMAAAHGTTALVATPHANPAYRFEPGLVRDRLEELRTRIEGALTLYSGCDFHLSYENIQDALKYPTKYTINQKSYLLVEFSDLLIFRNTPEIFGRLAEAGMTPVITHPERNGLLRQRADEIASWVELGATVQVTAQSLAGDFGRRAQEFSETLLDRGMVHFVASDAHDCERRPPVLDDAYEWLRQRYGPMRAEALCLRNPQAAIAGEPLEPCPDEIVRAPRKWYQIWH